MTEQLPEAVFVREGTRFVPTSLAAGPWHQHSQHGSAMTGLLAACVEGAPCDKPMQVARFTVDLMRAAPLEPLHVEVETRHAGKTTELLEARLIGDGFVFARAHAARYRVDDLPVGSFASSEAPPELDESARVPFRSQGAPAFHDALHLAPVRGFDVPAMWVRMLRPLIAGEILTPLVRVAVAVDWVYAAAVLRTHARDPASAAARPFSVINTDNHAVLTRPLEGEWVCLDASVLHGTLGGGAANARLFDRKGLVGFATQALLQRGTDKRQKAWK